MKAIALFVKASGLLVKIVVFFCLSMAGSWVQASESLSQRLNSWNEKNDELKQNHERFSEQIYRPGSVFLVDSVFGDHDSQFFSLRKQANVLVSGRGVFLQVIGVERNKEVMVPNSFQAARENDLKGYRKGLRDVVSFRVLEVYNKSGKIPEPTSEGDWLKLAAVEKVMVGDILVTHCREVADKLVNCGAKLFLNMPAPEKSPN